MIETPLLKCLECRLVGAPPKFDLPPPPPLPMFGDEMFADRANGLNTNERFLKRCFRFPGFGVPVESTTSLPLNNEASQLVSKLIHSDQALYAFFLACSVLFAALLVIAIVFLAKLLRVKKQLSAAASDSHLSQKTLSASITSSTASSNMSSSNTMCSQLSNSHHPHFYNELFVVPRVNNHYLQPQTGFDEYAEITSQHLSYDTTNTDWLSATKVSGLVAPIVLNQQNILKLQQNRLGHLNKLNNYVPAPRTFMHANQA